MSLYMDSEVRECMGCGVERRCWRRGEHNDRWLCPDCTCPSCHGEGGTPARNHDDPKWTPCYKCWGSGAT